MTTSFVLSILLFLAIEIIEPRPDIYFQESDLILPQGTQNSKRKPISKPDICGDDELLYPGDLDDDWVCDCRPSYVYHPDYDKCFNLYRQGPCPRSEILVLKEGSKTPLCERNQCQRRNEVMFKGRCYALGQKGPCTNILTADVVEVNETTLELGCVRTRQYVTQLNSRFSEVLELNGCKKGTKKDQRICEEKNVKYWIASEICGEDKALYKISNEEERICDCKPGYIYHMDTKMCYKAHLRGPCNEGQVYVLNDDIGQCVMSECINHNEVPFKGKCVEFGNSENCSNGQMIGVDPVTYEIKCISPPDDSKPGIYIPDLPNCPKGNKRDMKNKC